MLAMLPGAGSFLLFHWATIGTIELEDGVLDPEMGAFHPVGVAWRVQLY